MDKYSLDNALSYLNEEFDREEFRKRMEKDRIINSVLRDFNKDNGISLYCHGGIIRVRKTSDMTLTKVNKLSNDIKAELIGNDIDCYGCGVRSSDDNYYMLYFK